MSYLNDPNYDPYEDLKKQEEAMQYSCNMDSVICDLGWYYLFFKNDLPKALEYFWKIIEKDEESVLLTVSFFFYLGLHRTFYFSVSITIWKLVCKFLKIHTVQN